VTQGARIPADLAAEASPGLLKSSRPFACARFRCGIQDSPIIRALSGVALWVARPALADRVGETRAPVTSHEGRAGSNRHKCAPPRHPTPEESCVARLRKGRISSGQANVRLEFGEQIAERCHSQAHDHGTREDRSELHVCSKPVRGDALSLIGQSCMRLPGRDQRCIGLPRIR
jgi:hypothetical protein